MGVLKIIFLMLVAISTALFCLISFDEIGIFIPESNKLTDWVLSICCMILSFFCTAIVTGLLAFAIY